MTKLNNFHGFFPEGYLRQDIYRKSDILIEKIILEVDKLIDEMGLDLERYLILVKSNQEANHMITKLWGQARAEGIEKIQPHIDQMDFSAKARNEMISPIYDILISRGYTDKQLKR